MTPRAPILLIECWLGPFPPWRPLYEASCKANPNLDFLILTDQVTVPRRDANLRYEPLTRASAESLVASRAGRTLCLSDGWRLCKLKPAYGLLFADYLVGYRFWGYHDSDLVWGDTRHFLSDSRLDAYDAITPSAAWAVGHLTIFKIGTPAARPDLIIPDYWRLLLMENHKGVAIDEEFLDHALWRLEQRGLIRVLRAQWLLGDGFHPRWMRRLLENVRILKLDARDYVLGHGICRWDGHTLVHEESGRQALYFHFQHWKRNYVPGRVAYSPLVAEYRFSPERIEASRLKHHTPASWAYWVKHEFLHRLRFNLKCYKAKFYRRFLEKRSTASTGSGPAHA